MPLFSQHLQKVLVFDPAKAFATTGAFIDQRKDSPLSHGYQIFLLSEIRSNDHIHNQLFIQHLQERFSSFFASREDPMSESLFEEGLHSINKAVPNLISEFSPDWLDRVTLIAGAVFNNMILFSQVGEATLLLFHGNHITDISTQPTRINPLKVFSEVLTGKLEDRDSVFMSTSNFLDYFSQEKIRRIVEENQQDSIAKGFDQYLLQAPPSSAFAAVSTTIKLAKPISVESYIKAQQQAPIIHERVSSMEELIEREQTTEEIMSPKLFPQIKKGMRQLFRSMRYNFKKYVQRKPARISPILNEQETKPVLPHSYPHPTQKQQKRQWHKQAPFAMRGVQKMLQTLGRSFRNLKPVKNNQQFMGPQVSVNPQKRKWNMLPWFRRLSQRQKILFVVAIILIASFAESIVLIGNSREQKNNRDQISHYATQVSQQAADIRAAKLYGDDVRISQAIADLQSIKKNIPNTKSNQTLLSTIASAITEGQQRLQKIRSVVDPKKIANLTALNLGVSASGLELLDPNIYALYAGKKQIVSIQKSTGAADHVTDSSDSPPLFMFVSNGKIIIFHQNLTLKEFSPLKKTFTDIKVTMPGDAPNISAGAAYLGRYYFIDVSQNKLLRFSRSGNSLSAPTSWIQDANIKLAGATAVSVDGSVYIGYTTGKIIKLLQGKSTDFTTPALLDPISSLNSMFPSPTNDRLYILENSKNRVLTLKKDGTLIEQIVFPSIKIIDGFSVDEKNKTLYVISGSTLFSETLTPVK